MHSVRSADYCVRSSDMPILSFCMELSSLESKPYSVVVKSMTQSLHPLYEYLFPLFLDGT